MQRVSELLREPAEAYDGPTARPLRRLERAMTLDGVSFGHAPERRDLTDIRLTIQ